MICRSEECFREFLTINRIMRTMKKMNRIFCGALLACATLWGNPLAASTASEYATVGMGKGDCSFMLGGNKQTVTLALYKASEVGIAGKIKALSWYTQVADTSSREVFIYLQETTDTVVAAAKWSDIQPSLKLYQTRSRWRNSTGWNTFDLDSVYNYSGNKNLLVTVRVVSNYNLVIPNPKVYGTLIYPYQCSRINYGNINDISGTQNTTVDLTRPNLRFTFEAPEAAPVAGFVTSNQPILFFENFDGQNTIPTGWTEEIKGGGGSWTFDNSSSPSYQSVDGTSVYSALLLAYGTSTQDSWLKSPYIAIPQEGASLEFSLRYHANRLDAGSVELYAQEEGQSEVQLWSTGTVNKDPKALFWEKVSKDLTTYAGKKVRLAWRVYGPGGHNNGPIGLDDVKLIAAFDNGKLNVMAGNKLQLINKSRGMVDSYRWTLEGADTPTSTDEDPYVGYSTQGLYKVKLVVSNPFGADSMEANVIVLPPKTDFTFNLATAGTLKDQNFSPAIAATVTKLTVTGSIDARDVQFMRDSMTALAMLDLSGTTVVAYRGSAGTRYGSSNSYPVNEMPQYSFYNSSTSTGKTSLTSIVLPSGVTNIGSNAFNRCTGITEIVSLNPKSASVGSSAFGGISTAACTVKVSTASVSRYSSASQWRNFTVEGSGIAMQAHAAISQCGSVSGAVNCFYASGNQNVVVTAVPTSGLTFEKWTSGGVEVSTDNPLTVTLTQDTALVVHFYKAAAVHLSTAGTLCTNLANVAIVTRLTITGSIDARDVAFMRDSMVALTELDLSSATVVAYNGSLGTDPYGGSYPANEMPSYSFYNSVTSGSKTSLASVVLPSNLTSIGDYAFNNSSGLTDTLRLPSGLTSIGSSAFYGCSRLKGSLAIPAGVTSIGTSVFSGCYGLTGIILPAGLTSIGNSAFSDCSGLTGSLTIPAGVTSIGNTTFENCSGLTGIILPAGLTSIGNSAFKDCYQLTGSFTIPAGVTSIGNSAFENCSGLTGIILPAGLTSIANSAFKYCSGLTEVANLNPQPVAIDSVVFQGINKAICVLKVSTAAVNRYSAAMYWKDFAGIQGGNYVVSAVPNNPTLGSVSGVAQQFYTGGANLTLVATPASGYSFRSWTTRSGQVISTNPNLSITVGQDSVLTANFELLATVNLSTEGTLCSSISNASKVSRLVLTGSIDASDVAFMRDSMVMLTELDLSGATVVAYSGAMGTYGGISNYPANEMPQYSFYNSSTSTGKTSLKSVVFPVGLTSIGNYAFRGCIGLTGIILPAGLTSIGNDAFYNCIGLTGVALPAGLRSIGSSAFRECIGLTEIVNLNPQPVAINSNVFQNVRKDNCVLKVGSASLSLYQNASVWKDFTNIVGAGYVVNAVPNATSLGSVSGIAQPFYQSGANLTLEASPKSGCSFRSWTTRSGQIISTNPNLSITVTTDSMLTANFGQQLTMHLPYAGALRDSIRNASTVWRLALTGSIDARDVAFMRDNMAMLAELDLSGATVVAYSGTEGPRNDGASTNYPAGEMPEYSFYQYPSGPAKTSLVSVVLPLNLTSVGKYSFRDCTGLIGTLTLPSTLVSIGSNSLRGCAGFTGPLTLPSGVTSIGNFAFYSCSGFTGRLTLPVGVTSVGSSAFYRCSGFTGRLTLPATLMSIGDRAFYSCSGFTEIVNFNPQPVAIVADVFYNVNKSACVLKVPEASANLYRSADNWKDFTNIVAISDDATLSSLTVSGGTLLPALNDSTTTYTVRVGDGTTSVRLAATANHSLATVSDTGTYALTKDVSIFSIGVLADDEVSARTYTVVVARVSDCPDTLQLHNQVVALKSDTTQLHADTLRLYGQVVSLQNDTAQLHTDTLRLYGQVVALEGDTVQLHADTLRLYGQVVSLQNDTAQLHADTLRLYGQVVSLQNDTTSLNANIAALKNDTANLKAAGAALRTEVAQLKTDTLRLHAQVVALEGDTVQLHADTLRLYGQVVSLQNDTTSLNVNIAVLKNDTANLKAAGAALRTEVAQLKTDTLRLHGQVTQRTADTLRLYGQVIALKSENSGLRSQLTQRTADTLRLYGQVNVLKSQLMQRTVDTLRLYGQVLAKQNENTSLQGTIAVLRDSIAKLLNRPVVHDTVWLTVHDTVYLNNPTATAKMQQSVVKLYPNPVTNGELIVENGEWKVGEVVEIYSMSGALVATYKPESASASLNVSGLPNGSYVLKVGRYSAKFVKQ